MQRNVGVALVTVLVMLSASYGQITITSDEMPHTVGTYIVYDEANSVDVDLGTPGGGRTWNFSSQVTEESYDSWIVDKAETPFADSFPTANLVSKEVVTLKDTAIIYMYSRLTTDEMVYLGMGTVNPGSTIVMAYEEPMVWPLPIGYQNSWYMYSIFRYTIELMETVMEWRIHCTVDAWGTVNIPYGSFDCLRIQQYDTMITTVYVMGTPVAADTTGWISYPFFAENYGQIVSIKSYPGETNPNFTTADYFSRLSYFSTGISEDELLTHNFELSNYPNPFTTATEINYTLPQDARVKLDVFNLVGEKITTLVDGRQTKGAKTVRWDAPDLPGGIYLYRIETGGVSRTSKMILLR